MKVIVFALYVMTNVNVRHLCIRVHSFLVDVYVYGSINYILLCKMYISVADERTRTTKKMKMNVLIAYRRQ